jgi:hypothetical protein
MYIGQAVGAPSGVVRVAVRWGDGLQGTAAISPGRSPVGWYRRQGRPVLTTKGKRLPSGVGLGRKAVQHSRSSTEKVRMGQRTARPAGKERPGGEGKRKTGRRAGPRSPWKVADAFPLPLVRNELPLALLPSQTSTFYPIRHLCLYINPISFVIATFPVCVMKFPYGTSQPPRDEKYTMAPFGGRPPSPPAVFPGQG